MTKTISILSDIAINQIAAGEVVEGPASVVKELVENAVDAGATKITVEITGGGHFLIEVSDNGKGMEKEDVELSIERFATSKIASIEDLNNLNSMGFRGEALAAISSVSKFSILSSTGGVGTLLETNGGKDLLLSNAPRNKGTTISVKELFFNTPARKKFQKARGPSTTEIVKCITKLSLCHKEVSFTLIVDGKEVFYVDTKRDRVAQVLGKDFFSPEIPIHYKGEGVEIHGVISGPEKSRSNRMGQYLVVNKRNVYSLLISNAVLAGFGTSLGKGDYPLFFLDMTFDPSKIDVNVHPQKKEIRFQEEEIVFALIRDVIFSALTGEAEEPAPVRSFSQSFPSTNAFKDFTFVDKKDEETLFTFQAERKPFVQPFLEEKGHLEIKLLWDELCLLKVFAPHQKFPQVEEEETVLIDLSLLEKKEGSDKYSFIGQKLLEAEEIFLTAGEVGTCKEYESSFKELGFGFTIKEVSVLVDEVPPFARAGVKDTFMYALHLFQRGEHLIDVKEKIVFRILRKKRYTESEAKFLIENAKERSFGKAITKKDLKGLCREFIN